MLLFVGGEHGILSDSLRIWSWVDALAVSRFVQSLSEDYNLTIVSINELIFFVVCRQDHYWCLLLFHTDADGFGASSYLKI